MAKYEEVFRMRADADEADVIEQFFTERGIDFTIRSDGCDAHEYGILSGKYSVPKGTVVTGTDVLPYDAENNLLPVKITLSDGSCEMIKLSPNDYVKAEGVIYQKGAPLVDVLNTAVIPSATEDMDAYEFNTSLINDFIQFLKPYNLDVKAQEIVLNSISSALDHCEEIRAGKANLPEATTFSIKFDKGPTLIGQEKE